MYAFLVTGKLLKQKYLYNTCFMINSPHELKKKIKSFKVSPVSQKYYSKQNANSLFQIFLSLQRNIVSVMSFY